MIEIYALYHPVTDELRYIGKAKDSAARLKRHLRDAKRRRTPLYDWVRSLASEGLAPGVAVIRTVPDEGWRSAEIEEIALARKAGLRLLNLADGGDEPYCPHHVRVENGRRAAISRTSTPQKAALFKMKREIGLALSKGWLREETKAKLRLAAAQNPRLFGEYASL